MGDLIPLNLAVPATFEETLDCETETDVLAFFLTCGEARFDNGAYEYPVNQQAWQAWVEQPDVHEELQAAYSRLAACGDEISLLLDVHARRLYCGALMVIERLVVKRYNDRGNRIGAERARILP